MGTTLDFTQFSKEQKIRFPCHDNYVSYPKTFRFTVDIQ